MSMARIVVTSPQDGSIYRVLRRGRPTRIALYMFISTTEALSQVCSLLAKASVSHAVHTAENAAVISAITQIAPTNCSCMAVDDRNIILIGNNDMSAQDAWRLASLSSGRQRGLRRPNQNQIARLLLPYHSKLLIPGVEPHAHNLRVSVPLNCKSG